MKAVKLKDNRRNRRKMGVRRRLRSPRGTQPRLSVSRSLKHISAQVIDDLAGRTICQASTSNKDLRDQIKYGGNRDAATAIGKELAGRAVAQGVSQVVFDRNSYRFHGRIKALADAAREGGLKF